MNLVTTTVSRFVLIDRRSVKSTGRVAHVVVKEGIRNATDGLNLRNKPIHPPLKLMTKAL